ncbi:hypothetical protein V1498_06925 [Peribacillus sp. SCS-26]|uniref:hypothetical protein n=1 Tax=Paraperibacillus marinus TaxID=3115295 RepID=UPI0039061AF7
MFAKKIEVIPFKDFMSPPAPSTRKTPLPTKVYSIFPAFTIKSLFPMGDPTFTLFLVAAGAITGIALTEKFLEAFDLDDVASVISTTSKFLIPTAGLCGIVWVLLFL